MKNNVFVAEDIAAIAKGEDPEKSESDGDNPKKKSRKVSCNALRIVIKSHEYSSRMIQLVLLILPLKQLW